MSSHRILIVEDDVDVSEMLNHYFETLGYEVVIAAWGEDAIPLAKEHVPDVIVLDIRLPGVDGFEVCRQLRSHRRTESVPVIFLTERWERTDRIIGLELGAVDYITKPFDFQELRLRVRNVLQRADLATTVNPVTNLPTGPLVDEQFSELLEQETWALLSIGVYGLREFSNQYGFVVGDRVLRAIALTMSDIAKELGETDAFVGHLDESNFVLVALATKINGVDQMTVRLKRIIDCLYPLKAQKPSDDERPQISLAVGVVNAGDGPFQTPLELKQAVVKSQAMV